MKAKDVGEGKKFNPERQEAFKGFKGEALFILRRLAENKPEILGQIDLLVIAATENAAKHGRSYDLSNAAKIAAVHKAIGQYHTEKHRLAVAVGVIETYLAESEFAVEYLRPEALAKKVERALLAATAPGAEGNFAMVAWGLAYADAMPSEGMLQFACERVVIPAHKAEWEAHGVERAHALLAEIGGNKSRNKPRGDYRSGDSHDAKFGDVIPEAVYQVVAEAGPEDFAKCSKCGKSPKKCRCRR